MCLECEKESRTSMQEIAQLISVWKVKKEIRLKFISVRECKLEFLSERPS